MSTDDAQALTSIEKIQLAKEYRVAKWMEEGLISLVYGDYKLTRADLATLGWETSALILWIRDNSIPSLNNPRFHFNQDMIQCWNCSSNLTSELYSECYSCDGVVRGRTVSSIQLENASESGKVDPLVKLEDICCSVCDGRFYPKNFRCRSCTFLMINVRIALNLKKGIDERIDEVFGDEIK